MRDAVSGSQQAPRVRQPPAPRFSPSASPMSQHLVLGRVRSIRAICLDQLTPFQPLECDLHRAFGQTRALGDVAKARRNFSPVSLLRLPIKVKIDQKSRRMTIVADQVA